MINARFSKDVLRIYICHTLEAAYAHALMGEQREEHQHKLQYIEFKLMLEDME